MKVLIQTLIGLLLMMISHKIMANTLTIKHDSDAVKKAISQVNKNYGHGFTTLGAVSMLNCYAVGAIIMPANSDVINDKSEILSFFKRTYKIHIRNIVFTTARLLGLTDQHVTEQGNYEVFDANNKSIDKGKYFVLWTKTPDGWKMYRDMFSSSNVPVY